MAKQRKQTTETKKKVEEKRKEKARPPHFVDEPFFKTPIGELKKSPTFVPSRSLKEQIELDRPSRRKQRGGVRRVKG